MRPMSLAHLTVLEADPVALVEAGQAGGFQTIGLRVVAPLPTDTIIPVVGDAPLQRRIKAVLDRTGLSILDIEAIWLQPESDLVALKAALEVGALLGARHAIVVGFDRDQARLDDNFGALCAMAKACGLRVMFEFIPYSTVRTLAEAHALLARVAPADAGILVDSLHLSRSGGHPRDIAAYDPALFTYVHLCDAPAALPPADAIRAEARGNRENPGAGGLWLDAFLDAFAPGTPVGIEIPNAATAHLPILERARLTGAATRAFLDRHDGARPNG